MRVIAPYTKIVPAVEEALKATGWAYERPYVGDSDSAYCDLLRKLWAAQETFCIIEHDIVVQPDTLDELAGCPEPWCSFPAPYLAGNPYHGLGCVKFSHGLIERNAMAMEVVALMSDATHPPAHWCRLDAWLQGLVLRNESRHYHETVLGHIKDGRTVTHGCVKEG